MPTPVTMLLTFISLFIFPNSLYSLQSRIHNAQIKTSGGYISGEVKLAISIRILAGGDPYDIGVLYDISPS